MGRQMIRLSGLRRTLLAGSLFLLATLSTSLIWRMHATQAAQRTAPAKTAKKAGTSKSTTGTPSPRSAALQTLRNIGKAYYEQGKYPESVAQFQKVIASGQALATDHMDLGLGLMQADRLDEALGEMNTAKQMDPKLVAIDYNLGILFKRESRYPDAEAALKRVIEADPREPSAWLNLGVVYFSEGKLQDAMGAYQHLLDMGFGRGQNFYVAALFRMSTALFRLKRTPEAQKYLELHAKMKDKVPSVSVQTAALEGGKYGAVLVPAAPVTMPAQKTPLGKVSFAEITSKLGIELSKSNTPPNPLSTAGSEGAQGGSIATGDYDGDGRTDLYVVSPVGGNHLFHNNGNGTFSDVTAKAGVAGPAGSLSATFADYDNSGHPSLFVVGLGGVTLYHNNGNGTFTDVTEKAGLKGKSYEYDTRAVLFDADDDGFLDLVVTAWGEVTRGQDGGSTGASANSAGLVSHFYRNNADGVFTDMTEASGLGLAKGQMRGAVFADFNNDGYTDLLFFRENDSPILFINQGEDEFVDRTAEAGAALAQFKAVDAQVADFNHDGNFDLVLWGNDAYSVLLNRGNARFESARNLPPLKLAGPSSNFRGTVVDVNGSGFADLLAVDSESKWHLIANRGGQFEDVPVDIQGGGSKDSAAEGLVSLGPAWLHSPGKLDLLMMARQSGKFTAFEKEGPPARWLEVKLTGRKSNMQGVGTIVELKAGNFYEKVMGTGGPVKV